MLIRNTNWSTRKQVYKKVQKGPIHDLGERAREEGERKSMRGRNLGHSGADVRSEVPSHRQVENVWQLPMKWHN